MAAASLGAQFPGGLQQPLSCQKCSCRERPRASVWGPRGRAPGAVAGTAACSPWAGGTEQGPGRTLRAAGQKDQGPCACPQLSRVEGPFQAPREDASVPRGPLELPRGHAHPGPCTAQETSKLLRCSRKGQNGRPAIALRRALPAKGTAGPEPRAGDKRRTEPLAELWGNCPRSAELWGPRPLPARMRGTLGGTLKGRESPRLGEGTQPMFCGQGLGPAPSGRPGAPAHT